MQMQNCTYLATTYCKRAQNYLGAVHFSIFLFQILVPTDGIILTGKSCLYRSHPVVFITK